MPPVVITKVCPTARITRIAAATSIDWMLPVLRNVGLRIWKTMTSSTRPTAAAHSAQKLRSLILICRAFSAGTVAAVMTAGP